MKTNEIQFGGKSYVCRIVEANDGEELLIAPTTLLVLCSPVVSMTKTKVSPVKKPKAFMTKFSSLPMREPFNCPKTSW